MYSSRATDKAVWQLTLDGKNIYWDFLIEAYEFNMSHDLRIFRGLIKDHVYLNIPLKMRNHLATDSWDSKC